MSFLTPCLLPGSDPGMYDYQKMLEYWEGEVDRLHHQLMSHRGLPSYGHYAREHREAKQALKSAQFDLWYDQIERDHLHRIDLHGMTLEFLDHHLLELVEYKLDCMDTHPHYEKSTLELISGVGSKKLHHRSQQILTRSDLIFKRSRTGFFRVWRKN